MIAHHETAPRRGFRCVLDDQPDFKVPRWRRASDRPLESTGSWMVNPQLLFSRSGRCPDASVQFSDAVSSTDPMAWVRDPVTSVVAPFMLNGRLTEVVAGLQPEALLGELPAADVLAILNGGKLVYDRQAVEQRRAEFREMLQRKAADARAGYATVEGVLNPYVLAALRTYFRQVIRAGAIRHGDTQSPRRWCTHNEPVARFIHHQLTPIVEAVVQTPIKPSYVYFASYENEADLKWHKDREQCEYSISMLIDYFPEPERESPWPLLLQAEDGIKPIAQKLGDLLIYRGRDLAHAREPIPPDHVSTHLFFHYVPQDYSGRLE